MADQRPKKPDESNSETTPESTGGAADRGAGKAPGPEGKKPGTGANRSSAPEGSPGAGTGQFSAGSGKRAAGTGSARPRAGQPSPGSGESTGKAKPSAASGTQAGHPPTGAKDSGGRTGETAQSRGTKQLGPSSVSGGTGPAAVHSGPKSVGGPTDQAQATRGPEATRGQDGAPKDAASKNAGVSTAGTTGAAGSQDAAASKAAEGAKSADTASKGMDGVTGQVAGGAAKKAIEGKGDSAARRNAGRYAGSAISGGIAGAQTGSAVGGVGAVPGAAAGAAKGVGAEAGQDAIKGAAKLTGGGPSAKPAKSGGGKKFGAGGTSYGRSAEQEDESSSGSKMAKGAAMAGTAAAAPPAAMMVTLMALIKWLKTLFMQMAALAANWFSAAMSWLAGAGKAVAGFVAAPFVAAGGMISTGVAAVLGVTLAPAVAISSAVTAGLAALAMVAGVLIGGVSGYIGGGDARVGDSRCVAPVSGGYDGGPIAPNELAHAKAVYGIFKSMGMPDENIAGILGNWSQESGVDPTSVQGIFDEPYKIGPRKQAKLASGSNFGIGLGQWTADRNRLLREYAASKGADWHSLELQLTFMTDPAGDNPSDVALIQKMISTSLGSPREAAIFFEEKWERAGNPQLANRIAAAERWYDEMQTWNGSSGAEIEPVVNENTGETSLNLGPVKPHVQQAAEHINAKFPAITTVGGYREESGRDPGDHPKGLAVDFMVPLNSEGKKTGQKVADYVVAHAKELNVQYVIWYQQIWNIDRADEGWRDMEDRGSPTQNHKDHPHVSFKPSGSMSDVAPVNTSGCENGGSSSVGLSDGGLDMQQAEAFMEEYNRTGDAFLSNKYNGSGPGQCNGDYVQNCVSFSVYFLNKYTSFQGYPAANGKGTARVTASMTGKELSDTPTVYSVFSHAGSSSAGHTGIVLGIDGDRLLIGEAGYCAYAGRARWVEPGEWQNAGWSFVDVSDLLKDPGELAA